MVFLLAVLVVVVVTGEKQSQLQVPKLTSGLKDWSLTKKNA